MRKACRKSRVAAGRAAALVILAVGACAPAVTHVPPPHAPPSGPFCFLGSSDPTLRPGDAWSQAAAMARMAAAEVILGARVRAGTRVTERDADDVSGGVALMETRGLVRGLNVVGWWRDREGSGPTGHCRGRGCRRPGTVWAVACVVGHEGEARKLLPQAFRGRAPAWIKRPGVEPGRACALGLSAPTLDPGESLRQAREDARERLSRTLCARVEHVTVDWSNDRSWVFPDGDATHQAASRVAEQARDQADWLDRRGDGPLSTPGVAYARSCVAWGDVGCDRSRDGHTGSHPGEGSGGDPQTTGGGPPVEMP